MTGDARVGRRVAEATWRRLTWLRTASWATFILVVATALSAVFVAASASASAVTSTYGYDTAAHVYDAPALFSSPDTATSYLRGSPPGPEVASREGSPSTRGCCVAAGTGDDVAGAAAPGPNFLVRSNGETVIVPQGASGPVPTRGDGFQFTGGSGGNGLHPSTSWGSSPTATR